MYIVYGSVSILFLSCFFLVISKEPPGGEPNLHVADIKPPGQVKTVEVEVEPHHRDNDEEDERDGKAVTTASPPETKEEEKDGSEKRDGESTDVDREAKEEKKEKGEQQGEPQPSQATPTAPPPPQAAAATTTLPTSGDVPAPTTETPPTVLPPLSMPGAQGGERPDSFGLDHPSSHHSITTSHVSIR